MLAAASNGDNSSVASGGIGIMGQNRTMFGTPPELMARWGYRWLGVGLGYDTTKFDLVPAWKSGDTTEKNIGNPLNVCQVGSTTVPCRWSHVYALNVDALTLTIGSYPIASLPSAASYSAYTLAVVTDSVDGTCTNNGGSMKVLCYDTGSAWAAFAGGSGGVSSFNGRSGTVTPQASDYGSY